VVLIDFGASNEFVGTATGTLVGKQAYIAPEQLRGKTVPQSDLYALGGTLHYLLTGRDPVPLSQADIRTILPDISEDMENIVMLLTAFEKEDRLASAEHLLEHLRALEAKHNVPALAVAAASTTSSNETTATSTLASDEAGT
jgi:serine/threonine protein kinase